jgi:hypothetical protein
VTTGTTDDTWLEDGKNGVRNWLLPTRSYEPISAVDCEGRASEHGWLSVTTTWASEQADHGVCGKDTPGRSSARKKR